MKTNNLRLDSDRHAKYEFLPAALEVLETPPIPFMRIIAFTIGIFFVLAVIWAWIGTIDVVAISTGRTVPTGNVKIIQPFETGVVRSILVKDGDSVKQGELLLRLDPTESTANLDALNIDLEHARIDAAQNYALSQPEPTAAFIPPAGSNINLIEAARRFIKEEHERQASAIQTIQLEIKRYEALVRSANIEQRKLNATLPLIEERWSSQKSLYNRAMASKPAVQLLEQEVIETKAALETIVETKREAQAVISASLSRILEISAGYRSNVIKRQSEAQKKISLLEQSIRKEQQRLNYLELKAPVDGVVQQLNVHTIGAVVNTAEPLLVIVPNNTPLEIESMILNKDIGFVEVGQRVEIKFEAFPFTRYGTLMGRLVSVSSDAIIHEQFGPVYKARSILDTQHIIINGKPIKLAPGMTASAEVKTGTRHIIDFFLSPLMRYKDESIRER